MRSVVLGFTLLLFACIAWAAESDTSALAASFSGKVLEVKEVNNYTYLRLRTRDGEMWAAVNNVPIRIGANVTIENGMVMNNFESKALNRTFDRIVFGSLAATGASASSAPVDMAEIHAGVAKPVDVGTIDVAKAGGPDGRTVAEINARKADLKGKTVVVRGKVVKFTPGVLGKNWIHLRDGSGSVADGSDDIVVTTRDETKIGDVVLVKGVVQTDRNLGSGYSYKVLIEDATLQ